MLLHACVYESMFRNKGRGVSIQRFYTLLLVEIHNFYKATKITVRLILQLAETIQNLAVTALYENAGAKLHFRKLKVI